MVWRRAFLTLALVGGSLWCLSAVERVHSELADSPSVHAGQADIAVIDRANPGVPQASDPMADLLRFAGRDQSDSSSS